MNTLLMKEMNNIYGGEGGKCQCIVRQGVNALITSFFANSDNECMNSCCMWMPGRISGWEIIMQKDNAILAGSCT